eukprot:CAMPEP_0114521342 /NCGR_PEP_ID=MMETSP0109-20121206/20133_1 /TAXON_ID=29199 /ORGANISM="Chlorarachnion reptans, Strain CCCM449" /LENGTH=1340 /DNA_ID=CAMNT_0001702437 /DNA_START=130 /DNA_END=4154 /DNA_ORIENTATION=-
MGTYIIDQLKAHTDPALRAVAEFMVLARHSAAAMVGAISAAKYRPRIAKAPRAPGLDVLRLIDRLQDAWNVLLAMLPQALEALPHRPRAPAFGDLVQIPPPDGEEEDGLLRKLQHLAGALGQDRVPGRDPVRKPFAPDLVPIPEHLRDLQARPRGHLGDDRGERLSLYHPTPDAHPRQRVRRIDGRDPAARERLRVQHDVPVGERDEGVHVLDRGQGLHGPGAGRGDLELPQHARCDPDALLDEEADARARGVVDHLLLEVLEGVLPLLPPRRGRGGLLQHDHHAEGPAAPRVAESADALEQVRVELAHRRVVRPLEHVEPAGRVQHGVARVPPHVLVAPEVVQDHQRVPPPGANVLPDAHGGGRRDDAAGGGLGLRDRLGFSSSPLPRLSAAVLRGGDDGGVAHRPALSERRLQLRGRPLEVRVDDPHPGPLLGDGGGGGQRGLPGPRLADHHHVLPHPDRGHGVDGGDAGQEAPPDCLQVLLLRDRVEGRPCSLAVGAGLTLPLGQSPVAEHVQELPLEALRARHEDLLLLGDVGRLAGARGVGAREEVREIHRLPLPQQNSARAAAAAAHLEDVPLPQLQVEGPVHGDEAAVQLPHGPDAFALGRRGLLLLPPRAPSFGGRLDLGPGPGAPPRARLATGATRQHARARFVAVGRAVPVVRHREALERVEAVVGHVLEAARLHFGPKSWDLAKGALGVAFSSCSSSSSSSSFSPALPPRPLNTHPHLPLAWRGHFLSKLQTSMRVSRSLVTGFGAVAVVSVSVLLAGVVVFTTSGRHAPAPLGFAMTSPRVIRSRSIARSNPLMVSGLQQRKVSMCSQAAEKVFDMSEYGDLPYKAQEVGLNQAIENAARKRDTAAVRVLERVRRAKHEFEMAGREVPWYRGGSKDRDRYDGVMQMSPLEEQRMEIERNRRKQDNDVAEKYWAKEDELLQKVRAQGLRIDDRDQWGLTVDVRRVLDDAAKALYNALKEPTPQGGKLISMKLEVDPMPWWNFNEQTIPVGIARLLSAGGANKVAVIPPPGIDISDQDISTLAVNDVKDAKVVYVMNPDLSTPQKVQELWDKYASLSQSKDVIVLDGEFGDPGTFDGKAVRQAAKDIFKGGIQSIQFIMEPVRLTRNVGGDPYPLPEWLKAAGYKATGNLAITGNSGTGKSSLTNAMRGLRPRDDGAAAVGVKETTLEPTPYDVNIDGKGMRLFDLPGAGTPKFPLATYIRNMGIKYFDLVVVASAGRFTENDLELMDELRRNAIPFFALRTKIDLEIRNAQQDSNMSGDEVLDKIRKDLEHYTLLPSERIYMVSSRRPEEFDFQRLKQDTEKAMIRALDLKLAKALTRKLDIKGVWNSV